jgi:16S rRNA (guanine527-N7)-methyltransferase
MRQTVTQISNGPSEEHFSRPGNICDSVKKWASENGIAITDAQLFLLARHQNMVLETNKHMNLTAITSPKEFALKHIIDSLTLLPYIPRGAKLGDVGAGAGFPGLVLSIMREDLHVTLIDSLRKRIFFLRDVVNELGLRNVECVHTRAEDLARGGIEFDICTARAVASMDKLVKWVLPITKPGGIFLAMKGPDVYEEIKNAKPALKKMSGFIKRVVLVEIAEGLRHSIVVVEKFNQSPIQSR